MTWPSKARCSMGQMEDPPTPTTAGQSEASWRHAGGSEIKRFRRAGSGRLCSPQAG